MKDQKMEVTWNRTFFLRLGKVRVQVWETIFVIIVPVDLLCYIFGRWCGRWCALIPFLHRICITPLYLCRI
jgi:hypothetical protein